MDFLFEHEASIRLLAFAGIFALLALLELALPRRDLGRVRRFRWINNFSLVVISTILVRFVFPTAAAGVAAVAVSNGWGLLTYVELPFWGQVLAGFVLRFHRVHHSDLDFDVTTGLRFHPVEILLSMVIKFMTISAIGAPVLSVVLFEIALNATSMFTHSNIRMHPGLERVLRWFIVTPEMHRIHHSVHENETNSNFCFNISLWDRLFGTYRAQPRDGHEQMLIGLNEFREPRWQTLRWLVYLPFITDVHSYATSRRQDAD